MIRLQSVLFILITLVITGMNPPRQEEVKLECIKRQHATRTCYYNFLVNGIPHHYIDNGCKGKKETIVKKAETGKLGLHKDWKIDCKAPKSKDNG